MAPVTERLRAFDAALSLTSVRSLGAVVGGPLSRPRFALVLVASFAALALAIAAVGVFGIVAFLVTRRTQEIGIRMALGARSAEVLRLVLAEGLRPVLLGITGGVLGAMLVARAMRALLYGLAPIDVASFAWPTCCRTRKRHGGGANGPLTTAVRRQRPRSARSASTTSPKFGIEE
ncbi:MAG: FtsX-like permease family protein [Gemmatimonadaceae bacterium]